MVRYLSLFYESWELNVISEVVTYVFITGSLQSSTCSRRVRSSNRVWATFIGASLSAMAFRRSAIILSTSKISCTVYQNKKSVLVKANEQFWMTLWIIISQNSCSILLIKTVTNLSQSVCIRSGAHVTSAYLNPTGYMRYKPRGPMRNKSKFSSFALN